MKYMLPDDVDEFHALILTLTHEIAEINALHGFSPKNPNKGESIALMHSELSEALEGIRHGNPADSHCPEYTTEEIEMADVIIRILHYSAQHRLRISKAILAKVEFNRTREYMHGGKKF